MKTAFRLLLGLLLALLLGGGLLAGWLLTTTPGAQWLAEFALEREPRLNLEVTGGSLLTGLAVRGLEWRDEGVDVQIPRLHARWQASCLLQRRVCLDEVRVDAPRIVVMPTEPPEAQPAADREPLDLPLAILLEDAVIRELELRIDQTHVNLGQARLGGSLVGQRLRLRRAEFEDLTLVLPEPEAAVETAPAAEREVIELPAVELPVAIDIYDLRLNRARLLRGEDDWTLRSLALSGRLHEQRLQLAALALEYEDYAARAEGEVELRGNYPLSLALELSAPSLLEEGPLHLALQLSDSVAELAVAARVAGVAELQLQGRLRPLQPQLPFQLEARWDELGWPLDSRELVRARGGRLELKGNLERYRLALTTAMDGAELPPAELALRAQGDLESLLIEQLQVAALDGQLLASGRLGWGEEFNWDAHLQLRGLDPGQLREDFSGRISGRIATAGAVGEQGWRLGLMTEDLTGELRGYPLALRARLEKDYDDRWQIPQLQLASGDNRIEVRGELTEQWDLQGRFELPQPQALLPEAGGRASGEFRLAGALATPDVEFAVDADGLRWQETASLVSGRIQGQVSRLLQGDSRIRWRLDGLAAGEQELERIEGELTGSLDRHALTLLAVGPVAAETARVELALTGSLAEDDWAGQLERAALGLAQQQWRLQQPLPLSWQGETQQLQLAAHCWGFRDARLCLQDDAVLSGADGRLQLSLRDYRFAWLAEWFPPGVFWDGPLELDGELAWAEDQPPLVRLQATSRAGEVLLSQEGAPALELGYNLLGLRLQLDGDGLRTQLNLDSDSLGNALVDVTARPDADDQYQLGGDVSLAGLRLALLRPFLPELQTLAGEISASGSLAGTLQNPLFNGEINLEQGAVGGAELPMELSAIRLQARIAGTSAELDGRFRAGRGEGRLQGSADWSDIESWRLNLSIAGDRLDAVYRPLAELRVSPDLRLQLRPGQVRVAGRITVPSGRVTLQEMPAQAVRVSDDVVVVRRAEEQEQVAPEVAASPWQIFADIQVVLGRDVALSGFGVRGRLEGSLRLRQEADAVAEAFGELRIEEGRYEAYGQRLEIRRGQMVFAGPVTEPSLNIEAVRQVNEVVAGLRIVGQPAQPQAELFSEPAMPESDVLSYILRGRPLAEAGPGTDETLAQAALALGALGGRQLTAGVAEQLGVEDFAVEVGGEGEETQFMVSGYLSPNLFLRYGRGVFEDAQQLTLRYHFHPRFHVEALRGVQNALDFFYTIEF